MAFLLPVFSLAVPKTWAEPPPNAAEKIEGHEDMKLGMHLAEFLAKHPHFQVLSTSDGFLNWVEEKGSRLYPKTQEEWDYLREHYQSLIFAQENQPQGFRLSFIDSVLVAIRVVYTAPLADLFWTLRDSLREKYGDWQRVHEDELAYVWTWVPDVIRYVPNRRFPHIQGQVTLQLTRGNPPDIQIILVGGNKTNPFDDYVMMVAKRRQKEKGKDRK